MEPIQGKKILERHETGIVTILSFCQPKKKGSLAPSVTKEHTQVLNGHKKDK